MEKDSTTYRILVVENKENDFATVEKMLRKRILDPIILHAVDFQNAEKILHTTHVDVILLDLNLPDKKGQALINAIKKVIDPCKIIIFTDEIDMEFIRDVLAQGISDYLIKRKFRPLLLYKSIIHTIEKNKILMKLKESQKRYSDLFHLSPLPMWVYNVETLKFLRVNYAALKKYGYSKKEFEKMTIKDIRPKEDVHILEKAIEFVKSHDKLFSRGLYRHQKKDGDLIFVELVSNIVYINHVKHELVLANDVTERVSYIKDIEEKNNRLQEIAFTQSHIVRAPLANMMGILHLAKDMDLKSPEGAELLEHFITCGNQLDSSIREIVQKSIGDTNSLKK